MLGAEAAGAAQSACLRYHGRRGQGPDPAQQSAFPAKEPSLEQLHTLPSAFLNTSM